MSAHLTVVPELRVYRPVSNNVPANSSVFHAIESTIRHKLRERGYATEQQESLTFLEEPKVQLLPDGEYHILRKQRSYRRLGTTAVARICDLEFDKRMALRYSPLPVELKYVDLHYDPSHIEVGYRLTDTELYAEEEACVSTLRDITHSRSRPAHMPRPVLKFARLQHDAPQIFATIVKHFAAPQPYEDPYQAVLDVVHIDDLSYQYPD